MAKKPDETPHESPTAPLVVPSHGKGMLRVGNPGNKGGGRPPDAFRQLIRKTIGKRKLVTRMADIANARIGEIKEVPDGDGGLMKIYTETPVRDQRGAIEALFKYGIGEEKGIKPSLVRANLELTIQAVEEVPEQYAKPLLKRLREIWGAQ